MSRPKGRHRARRDTGIRALRRPAVAATAAISTISVSAAGYATAASASATVTGSAQADLALGAPAQTSTALRAADSGVATDARAEVAAANQAIKARAAEATRRAAATARATKLRRQAAARASAARQAAAEAVAARRATTPVTSRDTVRPTITSSGNPQAIASSMLGSYGWGQDQMSCLVDLWNRESSWQVDATNASSGAYGIPQSLPASKMASAGADWRTDPATQIRWGLGYIRASYGSPCGAWGHSQATGWY